MAEFAISASTIVPLTIFALATVISVGKAPPPNLAKVTVSLAIFAEGKSPIEIYGETTEV